jgi:integrase
MGRNTDLNRWKNYLAPALGGRRVSTLTETDVQQLKTEMGGNAPATVRNTLELLRRLCNYGARLNLCPRLSFVIQMPKLENERIEFLDPDQLRRLIETLDGWPSQDVARMLKLAMLTGMRRGEIFRLKDSHIDRLHRLITIEESKGETTASIPISDAVMALLEEQLAWRDAKYAGSHYVFPGRKGEKRVDSTAVDRIKARAGLPKDFRIFHGLRHHFAVTLANSGMVDLSTIQGLLTHKSPEMTRRYGRFMPETRQRAANLAAELIRHKAQGNDHQPGKK